MQLARALGGLARPHWGLVLVLVVAAALRAGVAIAYRPAILFSDSWVYLVLAYDHTPVGIAPDRPSGYPLLIDLISIAGRSLVAITTVQHVAGLAVGVLVYVLVLRLGMRRLVAAGAAALVLLDGYAVALEQQIVTEAFFTLALVGAFYLAVARGRSSTALAASGLLLAAAATIRTVALFAVPVWAVYLIWSRGLSRVALAAAAGLLVPLLVYGGLHAARTDRFGFTQADGWFLYGRVGEIADCGDADIPAAARPLCKRNARDRREGASFHIWNADGPARRVFGAMSWDPDRQQRSNRILRQFAIAIIRDRPLRYAGMVGADFLRYFRPGVMSRRNSDLAITLPERGRLVRRNEEVRDRYFPDYVPSVRAPAALMRGYQARFHTPRWLMGALAAASLVAVVLALTLRRRLAMPRRRETLLLSGAALAMLLGSVATSEFVVRYMIPAVPLLVCGGACALADLAAAARRAASRFGRAGKRARLRPVLLSARRVLRARASQARETCTR